MDDVYDPVLCNLRRLQLFNNESDRVKVCVCLSVRVCMYVYARLCVHVRVCVCVCAFVCARVCAEECMLA